MQYLFEVREGLHQCLRPSFVMAVMDVVDEDKVPAGIGAGRAVKSQQLFCGTLDV
jgi:hypothetical protein